MAYRAKGDGSAGCGFILFGIVIIGVIIGVVSNLTENSQRSMIKKARDESSSAQHRRIDYEEYLDHYPQGKYVSEATAYIVNYFADLSLNDSMNGVSSTTNWDVIQGLMGKFPDSSLNTKLDSLVNAKVDIEYNNAVNTGTTAAWQKYKESVPEPYWRDADKRIDEIKKKAWGTESAAWRTAQRLNTLYAYEHYLELYPNGAHVAAADKKVIDLSVAKIFAGDHGTLPEMDKTAYGYSGRNTIYIKNDTQYTLTLLYSGKESKRLVLRPQGSGTVVLPDGTYRIAASVTASNVRSYAGTETLTGGEYEVSYYISTTRY